MYKHTISLKHAFTGISLAFKTQPNFRIHCLIACLVVVMGLFYKISMVEWAVIALTICWVLLCEMVNTATESMVDLITSEYKKEAGVAKDVAAGAVLLSAIASVVVGLIIFLPKI